MVRKQRHCTLLCALTLEGAALASSSYAESNTSITQDPHVYHGHLWLFRIPEWCVLVERKIVCCRRIVDGMDWSYVSFKSL
ncbi:hypothetical protein TSMEX_009557 [Taenia solium]|eukprot:TsM_000477300 transcript=TsM_000477300 gene=TsM_000477300